MTNKRLPSMTTTTIDGHVTVTFFGDVSATAPASFPELASIVAAEPARLTVDIAAVDALGAAGVAMIFGLLRSISAWSPTKLTILAKRGPVGNIFHLIRATVPVEYLD